MKKTTAYRDKTIVLIALIVMYMAFIFTEPIIETPYQHNVDIDYSTGVFKLSEDTTKNYTRYSVDEVENELGGIDYFVEGITTPLDQYLNLSNLKEIKLNQNDTLTLWNYEDGSLQLFYPDNIVILERMEREINIEVYIQLFLNILSGCYAVLIILNEVTLKEKYIVSCAVVSIVVSIMLFTPLDYNVMFLRRYILYVVTHSIMFWFVLV